MKKDFLIGLGIADETAAAIMAENGKDIEREKAKYADRDELAAQLEAAKTELQKLKDLKPEEMATKVSELTAQLEKVQAESAQKIAQIETRAKVNEFLAGKSFVNDFTKEAIAQKLIEGLNAEGGQPKTVEELFNEVTDGMQNILAGNGSPKPPIITSMDGGSSGDGDKASDAQVRAIMGLPPLKE